MYASSVIVSHCANKLICWTFNLFLVCIFPFQPYPFFLEKTHMYNRHFLEFDVHLQFVSSSFKEVSMYTYYWPYEQVPIIEYRELYEREWNILMIIITNDVRMRVVTKSGNSAIRFGVYIKLWWISECIFCDVHKDYNSNMQLNAII